MIAIGNVIIPTEWADPYLLVPDRFKISAKQAIPRIGIPIGRVSRLASQPFNEGFGREGVGHRGLLMIVRESAFPSGRRWRFVIAVFVSDPVLDCLLD